MVIVIIGIAVVVVIIVVVIIIIVIIIVVVFSCNPIARTSTVKVLQRIIDSEQIESVNKSILNGIADCCIGDIRAAINILQFTSTTGMINIRCTNNTCEPLQ